MSARSNSSIPANVAELFSRTRLRVLWIAGVCCAIACSRSPSLAQGPIEVGTVPAVIRFDQPVTTVGPEWELCFEFALPRNSHEAGDIRAVLLSSSGKRYGFTESDLDRRGEAIVCLIGRVVELDPKAADDQSSLAPVTFEAVELSAPSSMRLRGVRGGSAR